MMKARRGVIAALMTTLLAAGSAGGADLQPFVAGSAGQIRQARAGQAYVLALWSVSCTHCATELALLGEIRRHHPELPLVLVATDSPDERAALTATLQRYGLGQAENWVFADPFTERLRFEVDRRWQGELPRTYLHGRDGSVREYSGVLDRGEFERWHAAQHHRF